MGSVTTDGSLQDTHVLIAHPDERARGALRAVLERAGCAVADAGSRDDAPSAARPGGPGGGVAAAGSRDAALSAARRWCPDVLLLHADLAGALGDVKGDPDLFR